VTVRVIMLVVMFVIMVMGTPLMIMEVVCLTTAVRNQGFVFRLDLRLSCCLIYLLIIMHFFQIHLLKYN